METIISCIAVTRKGQIAGIVGRVVLLRPITTAEPDDCSPPLSEAASSFVGAKPHSMT